MNQSKEGHLASQLANLQCTLDQECLAHQERLQQIQQEHRASKALLAKELKLSMEEVSVSLRHELQVLCLLPRPWDSKHLCNCVSDSRQSTAGSIKTALLWSIIDRANAAVVCYNADQPNWVCKRGGTWQMQVPSLQ